MSPATQATCRPLQIKSVSEAGRPDTAAVTPSGRSADSSSRAVSRSPLRDESAAGGSRPGEKTAGPEFACPRPHKRPVGRCRSSPSRKLADLTRQRSRPVAGQRTRLHAPCLGRRSETSQPPAGLGPGRKQRDRSSLRPRPHKRPVGRCRSSPSRKLADLTRRRSHTNSSQDGTPGDLRPQTLRLTSVTVA